MNKTLLKILIVSSLYFFAQSIVYGQYSGKSFNWNMDAYEKYVYSNSNGSMPYRLLKPTDVDLSKKYPLVIMLHGKGEGIGQPCSNEHGNNECNVLWGGKMHLDSINRYPGYVVFPQTKGGDWISASAVSLLTGVLEDLCKNYNIDLDRVYIHGLSGGGQGVWHIAYDYPYLFAAISPHSAAGDPAQAEKLLYNPLWTVQGEKDTNPAPKNSIAMIDALRAYQKLPVFTLDEMTGKQTWPNPKTIGGRPVYTLVPNESHVAWPYLYNSFTWLAWMFSQNKRTIVVNGRTELSRGETVMLGVSPGFLAYEWSNGATTNEIKVGTSGSYKVRYKRYAYMFSGPEIWSDWSDPVNITVSESTPPLADAGKDVKIILPPISTVKIRGYGAGNNISYKWTKISGGSVVLSNINTSTLILSNISEDTYVFRLTVTDADGVSVYDDVVVKAGPASTTETLTGITLVNSDNATDILSIKNGDVINLASLPSRNINLRVDTDPYKVGSVKIIFDGETKIENGEPYTWFGDNGGRYNKGTLSVGSHVFSGFVYSSTSAKGDVKSSMTVNFTVIDGREVQDQKVVSFVLVNSESKEDIQEIADGDKIDLAFLPAGPLNIRANVSPEIVGSVEFNLDGVEKIRNTPPYVLFEDDIKEGNQAQLAVGEHTLTASPYEGKDAAGTEGTGLSITFTILNSEGTVTGLLSGEGAKSMMLFPNPFSDMLHLTFLTPQSNVHIYLYDSSGSLVFDKYQDDAGLEQLVYLPDLLSGVYAIRVVGSEINKTIPIVKQ